VAESEAVGRSGRERTIVVKHVSGIETMATKLSVTFTGLCLYVTHPDDEQVAVLMPDCRLNGPMAAAAHADGERAEPHAGCIRIDGIHMRGAESLTGFDTIFELANHEVRFSGLTKGRKTGKINVPNLSTEFFEGLALKKTLFGPTHENLLMRMLLVGGEFISARGSKKWVIGGEFNAAGRMQDGNYSGQITWETIVEGDAVELQIRSFEAPPDEWRSVFLVPDPACEGEKTVNVRFSNLCAHNFLEWDSLSTLEVFEDTDFKWLYRLFDSTDGRTLGERATATHNRCLPFPRIAPGPQAEGNEDCLGATVASPFSQE
jgi:hypothetical protein